MLYTEIKQEANTAGVGARSTCAPGGQGRCAHGLYLFKQLERRVPGRFRSSDFILDGVWQAEQLRRQHEDLDDQADFDFEMGETYDEEL